MMLTEKQIESIYIKETGKMPYDLNAPTKAEAFYTRHYVKYLMNKLITALSFVPDTKEGATDAE
jgi:hypothetical protein